MFMCRLKRFSYSKISSFLFILISIYLLLYLQPFVLPHDKNLNRTYQHFSDDNFTRCLIHAENAFKNLSLPWFLAFGSALMYHRSNNFISDDIDIGIFYDDLIRNNITERKLILTLRKFDFKYLRRYGQMNNGKGWTLSCPKSKLHFGIFIFYRINFQIETDKPYVWWTASYNGPCAKMPFKKCRRGFLEINLEKFQMFGKLFYVVSKQFLIDQYGEQWMIPHKYNYAQSIKIMPNLIDKQYNSEYFNKEDY
ncbi:unnamed protein product [Adineta steineri]|uniref:Uncharacterized protein n=1 Tax=Adineta steineri TaxID=433720 RepID=A0A815W965_9BILA|nr:unnamed protein product [Adineta steineri]CAF1540833.1 unnamed protein product [Adineta steineri]